MDAIFDEVQSWLDSAQENVKDASLYLADLARSVPGEGSDAEKVVSHALQLIEKVQEVEKPTDKPDLISVPLNDMKNLGNLVKIVVSFGIYAAIPEDVGLPMDPRTEWALKKTPELFSTGFLASTMTSMVAILAKKDDVSDVILLTPFIADLLTGAASTKSTDTFLAMEDLISTYALYKNYMQLLRFATAPWFRKLIAHELAILPLKRKDAVRALVELFSGYRESDSVSLDKVDQLSTILASVPKDQNAWSYIKAVGEQLYVILGTVTTPKDIVQVTVAVIHQLDLMRPKTLSALRDIVLAPFEAASHPNLEKSLMVLTNLIDKDTRFIKYLGSQTQILVWILFVSLSKDKLPNGSVAKLLTGLYDIEPPLADVLIQSLLVDSFNGLRTEISGAGDELSVQFVHAIKNEDGDAKQFQELDLRIDLLTIILAKLEDKALSQVFVSLLKRYTVDAGKETVDPLSMLVDVKVLERIAQDLKQKLFPGFEDIVNLSISLISAAAKALKEPSGQLLGASSDPTLLDQDSDDEDEPEGDEKFDQGIIDMCLSLIGGIILESVDNPKILKQLGKARNDIEALTAVPALESKASYTLKLLDTLESGENISLGDETADYSNPVEVLRIAKESLNDPLIPVRAHGLTLVTQLVLKKEAVLNLQSAMQVFLKELEDEDSFIYLNAIRGIEACSSSYGINSVVPMLLPKYTDVGDLDLSLRVGESLTRVVRTSAKALTMDITSQVIAKLLGFTSAHSRADDRLRMSSMTIAGIIAAENPLGLSSAQETDLLDVAVGILEMEKSEDRAIMRRSALVLLLEAANGAGEGGFKSVSKSTLSKVFTVVDNLATTEDDELARQYAQEVRSLFESFN